MIGLYNQQGHHARLAMTLDSHPQFDLTRQGRDLLGLTRQA
jgi:hypothetical protein